MHLIGKAEVKLRQSRLQLLSAPVDQRCGDVEAFIMTSISQMVGERDGDAAAPATDFEHSCVALCFAKLDDGAHSFLAARSEQVSVCKRADPDPQIFRRCGEHHGDGSPFLSSPELASRGMGVRYRTSVAVMLPTPPENLRIWVGPFADADL